MQEETKVLSLLLQDLTKVKENNSENEWKAEMNALAQQIHKMKEELAEYMKVRLEINSELDEKYAPEIGFLKRRLERANDVHAQKLEVKKVHACIFLEQIVFLNLTNFITLKSKFKKENFNFRSY